MRNTKILLLDEATASVDGETDLLVQKAIRENFCDSTVLTIAHRINTIMESDRILLIEEGELAELDSPQNLVETDSKFAQLVRHHYGLDPKEVYEAHLERLSKTTAIATSVGDLDVAERRDSCRVLTLDVEEEAKERERQVSVV